MKILALDTSGQTASAAILEDDIIKAEFSLHHKLTHSQTIMPMIDEICRRAEISPKELDYIACAAGPGSFTGLRIGAATAKGLAHGLGITVLPVPTLDALAYNICETDDVICPIMDARRQQVYTAFYLWENGFLVRLTEHAAMSIQDVALQAKSFEKRVMFLGDGVPVYRQYLEEVSQGRFRFCPPHCNLQRASSVAVVAKRMAAEKKAIPPHAFVPDYLRKPQAEREREAALREESKS